MSPIIRHLERAELSGIWTIDRSEVIEKVYHYENRALVLRDERYDVQGWPSNEIDRDSAILLDCFDHGGSFFGAFSDAGLVGACVLESRFIGASTDQLQLKFLHVSQRHRGGGLGRRLFQEAVNKARYLGARALYISATPSENTIRFYRSLGCRLADAFDPSLFDLEPQDIHLTLLL
ncbi:MAG: GNAT family N-acetyltransferase [Pseudomonadales bacterium]